MPRTDRILIRLAGQLIRVKRLLRRLLGIRTTVYVQDRVDEYRQYWSDGAKKLDLKFTTLASGFWRVESTDGFRTHINNYVAQLDDPATLNLAGDKLLTFQILKAQSVSIPKYHSVRKSEPETYSRCLDTFPGPYVVKPARGTSSGLGISTLLDDRGALRRATALALAYCEEAIVEQHVAGECYRLLYLNRRLVRASRRSGIRVVGDGELSLRQLLDRDLPKSWRVDRDVQLTLRSQRLQIDEVPPAGREVLVRSSPATVERGSEVRTVYTEDVTHLVGREIAEECRTAATAIGSEFCGVDVITTDPARSLGETGGVVDEINTTPGLHHHYGLPVAAGEQPLSAVSKADIDDDLAAMVLRYLAEKAARPM